MEFQRWVQYTWTTSLDLQAYYIKTTKVWSFNPKNQVYHQSLIEVQNSDKICDLQVQNV
jgi:hypothetical protein